MQVKRKINTSLHSFIHNIMNHCGCLCQTSVYVTCSYIWGGAVSHSIGCGVAILMQRTYYAHIQSEALAASPLGQTKRRVSDHKQFLHQFLGQRGCDCNKYTLEVASKYEWRMCLQRTEEDQKKNWVRKSRKQKAKVYVWHRKTEHVWKPLDFCRFQAAWVSVHSTYLWNYIETAPKLRATFFRTPGVANG